MTLPPRDEWTPEMENRWAALWHATQHEHPTLNHKRINALTEYKMQMEWDLANK